MKRFTRVTRGTISVLMCVLLTPFLTIAGLLIEFYRYQATLETLQETVDVSAYSTLSDYDEYLYKRFGLVAYSQDRDAQTEFRAIFTRNQCILGKNITAGDPIVKPSLPLTHTSGSQGIYHVLLNQINDFAETTVMAEMVTETFNIDELIQDLTNLGGLSNLSSAVGDMANLTEQIKGIVDKAETLKEKIDNIPNRINSIKDKVDALANCFSDLYKTILQNDLKSQVDEKNNVSLEMVIAKECALLLVDIYEGYDDLKWEVELLVSDVNSIGTTIGEFPGDINKAKETLKSISGSLKNLNDKKDKQETGEEAEDLYTSVLNKLEEAFNNAVAEFKKGIKESLDLAVEQFKDEIAEQFPILNIDQDYFQLPLSERALQDIRYIIQALPETWSDDQLSNLIQTITQTYIPSLIDIDSFSLSNIWNVVSGAVQNAKDMFQEGAKESIFKVLEALVNTIKKLFDMKGIYNSDLDAFLSSEALMGVAKDESNPYQTFLNAIKDLFSAINRCKEAFTGKWWEIFGAVKDFLSAGKNVLTSIIQSVTNTINGIKKVAGYISGKSETSFYDLMLLTSYLNYTLPNRTNAGPVDYTTGDDGDTKTIVLEGSAITGYKYSEIIVPQTAMDQVKPLGFNALANFVEGLNGNGPHNMFKGAELEYIIAGTESEIMNQTITFLDIMFIRLIANIGTVFTDSNVSTIAASATIASWAVYILYIVLEPLVDTFLIVNDGEVPLIKSSCYLTPSGIDNLLESIPQEGFRAALKSATSGIGGLQPGKTVGIGNKSTAINYSTYCMLIMMITLTEKQMLIRFSNIIHLEASAYYGDKQDFYINKTYTSMEITVPIELNSMLDVVDFGGSLSADIKRERGY